jgi:hypothetical protein
VNGLRNLHITSILLLLSPAAAAELPLTIEDLIAEEGRTQLDMSVTYANNQSQRLSTGEPIIVPTGDASFILLPTRFGEFESNTDAFIGTLGLRRGLTPDTEIYVRAKEVGYILADTERDFNEVSISLEGLELNAQLDVNAVCASPEALQLQP